MTDDDFFAALGIIRAIARTKEAAALMGFRRRLNDAGLLQFVALPDRHRLLRSGEAMDAAAFDMGRRMGPFWGRRGPDLERDFVERVFGPCVGP